MMGKLNTFTQAKEKAKSEEQGNLIQTLSGKIGNGETLTAKDRQDAAALGVLDDLIVVENRLDVTSEYGEGVVANLWRNPSEMKRVYGTVGNMVKKLRTHVEQETLRSLSGQWNASESQASSANSNTSKNNNLKVDEFSVTDAKVTESSFFKLDASHSAKNGQKNVREKLSKKHGDKSSTRTRSEQMLLDRFHIDVAKKANAMLAAGWKGDKLSLLEEASELVYQSGWVNRERTKNLYTSELSYPELGATPGELQLPRRPDELEPFQEEALKQLMEEERENAIQSIYEEMIPGVGVWNREEIERQASKDVLGIKGVTPNVIANINAARAAAGSTISPYDIDERASSLREKANRDEILKMSNQAARSQADIAEELLSRETMNNWIEHKRTTSRPLVTSAREKWEAEGNVETEPEDQGYQGFTMIRLVLGLFTEEEKISALPRSERSSSQRQGDWVRFVERSTDLKNQYRGSNWEDFALQFYPGDVKDLPKSVQDTLRNIPRSSDIPGKELTRFEALRRFYTNR